MSNRAYSVLTIKSVDDDKRTVRGVATTPSVDRMGDIIDPLGMRFENPLPFLWQHQHDQPIGQCRFDKPSKSGINFEATVAKIDEPGTLKDRLDEAWQSLKAGLVKAVSVGFRPIEYAFMDNGGIRYSETECYELSAVTIPANSDALITTIKALDAEFRHAEGVADPERPIPATGGLLSPLREYIFNKRCGVNPSDLLDARKTGMAVAKLYRQTLSQIPADPDVAATGKSVRVVKLDTPAGVSAPFVIKQIKR